MLWFPVVLGTTLPSFIVVIALGQAVTDQDAFNLFLPALALLLPFAYVRAKPTRSYLRFRDLLWPQLRPGEIVSTSPLWPTR